MSNFNQLRDEAVEFLQKVETDITNLTNARQQLLGRIQVLEELISTEKPESTEESESEEDTE